MLLGEWLDSWLQLYVINGDIAASTKAMYRRAVAAVPEHLRRVPLQDLTALQLMSWLIDVAARTPRAAQLDRVMLSRALRTASRLGLCLPGIVDQETVPKLPHRPTEAVILTRPEAQRYLDATRCEKCGVLLACCLVLGLRRGEALGLMRGDLDGQSGVLDVSRQRIRITGQYITSPLKSKAAYRRLCVPPDLCALILSQPLSLAGWVCDCTPEALQRAHHRVILAADVPPVTLHGLRHTMAHLAAGAGMPIKHLQQAMGHASYTVTADLYAAHSYPPSSAATYVGLAI